MSQQSRLFCQKGNSSIEIKSECVLCLNTSAQFSNFSRSLSVFCSSTTFHCYKNGVKLFFEVQKFIVLYLHFYNYQAQSTIFDGKKSFSFSHNTAIWGERVSAVGGKEVNPLMRICFIFSSADVYNLFLSHLSWPCELLAFPLARILLKIANIRVSFLGKFIINNAFCTLTLVFMVIWESVKFNLITLCYVVHSLTLSLHTHSLLSLSCVASFKHGFPKLLETICLIFFLSLFHFFLLQHILKLKIFLRIFFFSLNY